MITRLHEDVHFMSIALAVASRSTCIRRSVGCVIVDDNKRVMSTGYNGVPRNLPHCIDEPCLGAGLPSGTRLDLCMAIHAEQNALAQCKNTLQIYKVYSTYFPCSHCLKQLANTSVVEIHYLNPYPSENIEALGKNILYIQQDNSFLRTLEGMYVNQREGGYPMGHGETVEDASGPPIDRGYKHPISGYGDI